MELQLGLALPSTPPIKGGFDLNNFVYEANKEVTLTTSIPNDNNNNKKRRFAQASDEHNKTTAAAAVPRTLPLLLWNNQPNDDDNDEEGYPNEHQHNNSRYTTVIKNDGDGLVGWPPIKSWRKEICFHNQGGYRAAGNGCGGCVGGRGSLNHRSTFVKVKMEGVGIARKIDLSLHHSFQTLIDTLMDMFDKCQMDSNNYKLTYQDRDGDWLLAQDVPWRSFIRSVQRLKLLKIEE